MNPVPLAPVDFPMVELPTLEALFDLLQKIGNLNDRLSQLEQALVEAAGADPLADILTRLDAIDARLAKIEQGVSGSRFN
jgi:hypothetical protein